MTISISQSKRQKKTKKVTLTTCLALLTLAAIGYLASGPILNKIDQNRFVTLDLQMQRLFADIKSTSDKSDVWVYRKSCEPERSGPWATGNYYCSTKISMTKTVTSVKEIADLQSKYYPIINNSEILKAKSDLDLELPGDFGKNFVVSSAEKRYRENSTKISCTYLNKLYQINDNGDFSLNKYSATIVNDIGNINISLKCTDRAYEDRYIAK